MLSPLFSIDGLGSLLILETDLGLVAWETGLGFLLIFETGLGLPVGNGLGGVVVDGLRFAGCMSCIAYVIMHCVLFARKPR